MRVHIYQYYLLSYRSYIHFFRKIKSFTKSFTCTHSKHVCPKIGTNFHVFVSVDSTWADLHSAVVFLTSFAILAGSRSQSRELNGGIRNHQAVDSSKSCKQYVCKQNINRHQKKPKHIQISYIYKYTSMMYKKLHILKRTKWIQMEHHQTTMKHTLQTWHQSGHLQP